MAPPIDWTSAVGDLDPAVLDIQLNNDPKVAGEILNKIHNLSDYHDRRASMTLFSESIAWLGRETLARICEEPEGLQRALTEILSTNFLCGFRKDDFLGPSAIWCMNYTYVILEILNRSICWIAGGLESRWRPILQQLAQETLAKLSPMWDKLAQFAPASGWYDLGPDTDLSNTLFAFPATCAAKVGLKIVILHHLLRRLAPNETPALNTRLISYIIHAFCLALPNVIMNEFNRYISDVLGLASEQERRAIIAEVFSNEIIASLFFKAYTKYLSGNMNPPKPYGDSSTTREVKIELVQIFWNFLFDGPEVVLRAVSSPGTLEKIIRCTMYAAQWAWCHDEPKTHDYFLPAVLKTIRAITRPVLIRRQYMQHQFSLDARTSHILLCHCAHGLSAPSDMNDVVSFLDCIDVYGLPGAKGGISHLSNDLRHDLSNLRQIIHHWLREPGEHLSEQAGDLRLRAERTMHRMKQELIPDSAFADLYTARLHRCSCWLCECSGMKAPHKMRICKGCLSVFYCSKLCQKRDWESGRHKEVCRGRARQ